MDLRLPVFLRSALNYSIQRGTAYGEFRRLVLFWILSSNYILGQNTFETEASTFSTRDPSLLNPIHYFMIY